MLDQGLGLLALTRNIGATFLRQITGALLGLITMALIARVYGPEGTGVYAVAMLLPSLLTTFLNLGVAPANVYHLGSGQAPAKALLRANVRIAGWVTGIGLGAGAVAIYLFPDLVFPGVAPAVLWLALVGFPLGILNGYLLSFFQGLQQFRPFNLILIAQPMVLLVLVVALTVAGSREFAHLVGAHIIAQTLVARFAWSRLRPLLRIETSSPSIPGLIRKTLSYGTKAHLSNVLAFINYRADVFIANLFLGPAVVGLYVVAVAIAEKLWMISQAVSTVALPRLSELTSDEAKRKQLTPLVTRWVLLVTLLAALLVALTGSPVIRLVFGPAFGNAFVPLLVLLPGIVAGSASRVLANDIAARGRPELNLYTSLVVVTVNVVGNLALIPPFGLVGAAAATTIAYVLNLLFRLVVYRALTGNVWSHVLCIQTADFEMLRSSMVRRCR